MRSSVVLSLFKLSEEGQNGKIKVMEEKDCEQRYQEYLVVKSRTSAQINGQETRGTYRVIDANDLLKIKELARELVWNCEEFLRKKSGDFYGVEKDADEICECGHSRNAHNGIKSFKDGDPVPKYKKDGECRVDECSCKKYILRPRSVGLRK